MVGYVKRRTGLAFSIRFLIRILHQQLLDLSSIVSSF